MQNHKNVIRTLFAIALLASGSASAQKYYARQNISSTGTAATTAPPPPRNLTCATPKTLVWNTGPKAVQVATATNIATPEAAATWCSGKTTGMSDAACLYTGTTAYLMTNYVLGPGSGVTYAAACG